MVKENKNKDFKIRSLLFFLISLAVAIAAIYLIGSFSKDPELIYGLLLIAFIPPAGKESIIPAMVFGGIEIPIIFSVIVFSDLAACLIIITSFEIVEYIASSFDYLSRVLDKAKERSEVARKYGLLHIGLGAFMFVPFQGTGSIVTSFLAQVLGVKNWKTVLIVLIGSIVSTAFFVSVSLGLIGFI